MLAKGRATTARFEARVAGDAPGGVKITNVAVATSPRTSARVAQVTVAVRGNRVVQRGPGVTG